MKRAAIIFLKVALPAALFVYLLWRVPASDYEAFWSRPKRWDLLALAQGLALTAMTVGMVRWWALVRAFGIPFELREALRLGFLGYLLNFVSLGSVGGDLFKAILVAKHKPRSRPEAVASVVLDRAIGLLGLVLLTVISLTFFSNGELSNVLKRIREFALALSLAAIVALLVAIYSGRWFERLIHALARLPLAGESLARMAWAVRQLRGQPATLLGLILASVGVHSLLALTVYFVSCGIYAEHPTLTEHLYVVPPAMAAGAIPLAPGGLGAQEYALDELFKQLASLPPEFSGMIVATVYRLITLAIAGIGLVYYWTSKGRELQQARIEAEELAHAAPEPAVSVS
ncbi:MAG: lysylphosphatidylglycerol synthase transmembrane domain-containing protein [Aureliella sp.]